MATSGFTGAENIIKDGGRPLSIHIFRLCYRNLIIALHNVAVMLGIYIWNPSLLSWNFLFLIPATVLLIINMVWLSLLVAIVCARFRDVPPIVANVVQMLFFVSPVIFKPEILPPELSFVVDYNPLAYMMEVMRSPLLGQPPSLLSFALMAVFALIGWSFTFRFFRMTRHRIAYWL
ncbi:ABC transporter permease [Pontivivens ytuae]|uniref:ABC transporter permease n=2 Tax=Pontivivens ytuae TaxID=2789856 RepID=A0A7S9LPK7_9RHOB|nr:ABC transporter permease [Pontivivens ytuae]QPH52615.1 ABC transporter permease [Pontivivens ytuae]